MRISSNGRAAISVWGLFAITVCAVLPASAQNVTLTDIANSNSAEFSDFGTFPTVNNSGVVAFRAARDAGGDGIYTATSTSSFNTIAVSTNPEFSLFGNPTINSSGTVAFAAIRDAGGSGIYTASNNSSFNAIATTATSPFNYLENTPSIDGTGRVAFYASRKTGGQGIFTSTGGNLFTTIASTDNTEFYNFGVPALNNQGTVAFMAGRNAGAGGGNGIYTASNSGSFNTLALTTSPLFASFGEPGINDAGTVAFFANRDGGGQGIYSVNSVGLLTTVATTDNPQFKAFATSAFGNAVSINNLGTVAFLALQNDGRRGIFASFSSAADPVAVVRTGDAFGGSTISSIDDVGFYRSLAPDSNIIAFQYTLQNGVTGVARANLIGPSVGAPEPGSLSLFGVGLCSGIGLVRYRRFTKCQKKIVPATNVGRT